MFLQPEKNPERRQWKRGAPVDLTKRGLNFLEEDEREPLPSYNAPNPEEVDTAKRGAGPQFKHNPLHELESTWWILLYIFSMREVHMHEPDWDRSAQKAQLNLAFPALVATKRTSFLHTSGFLEGLVTTLDPTLQPCYGHLENLRAALMEAFKAAEATLPGRIGAEVWSSKSNLYNAFVQAIQFLYYFKWPVMLQWKDPPKVVDGDEGPALKRRKVQSAGDLPKAGSSTLPPTVPATTSGAGLRSSTRLKSQARK